MCSYIVTVDTGGSKTQITLFDKDGNHLSEARCKGIGVTRESDAETELLTEALNALMDNRNFEDVSMVIINVGGTNTAQIKDALSPYFPNAQIEAYRESSGVIMSAICDLEKADVLLMAGTGSIALAKGKKGNIITDGWCPNIGDFGSGYWIGIEAISRSLLSLEKPESLSQLAKIITGRELPFSAMENTSLQMVMRDEVRSHFMPLDRSAVARLTRVASDCARNGDEMAMGIFYDAGCELAKTVIRAMGIAGCKETSTILVSGGLTACSDLWKDSFDETLKKERENCTWRIGEADMTKGALHYALNLERSKSDV